MEPISPELYKKLVKSYKPAYLISVFWNLINAKKLLISKNNYKLLKLTKLLKKMTKANTKANKIEKEKIVAETLNGRFAMIGLIAAIGAYLTTGQIIPGFV